LLGSGAKHQAKPTISLIAKGLTTGEVAAHLQEVYGVQVSKDHISSITDRVMEGMTEWCNRQRPLNSVYPFIFIDCIHVKIRDGQVVNRPIYVALATACPGLSPTKVTAVAAPG